ncbi:hypothetical protein [Streptomyces sp. NPDC059009]|uniref:hypothetical protein n=1 Tax=Streptomyces sp. NPDC059009 TaxID=3346694 RepID=UPI0036B249F5
MPLTPRKDYQVPDFWTVFGHSYMQYAFGTFYQTGRADSLLRGSFDIEHANWQNFSVNGARAFTEGASTGGFGRFLNRVKRPQRGGPYVADGGALLLDYGINDIGLLGNTTQLRTGWIHALRTMISRWRASVIYENGFQVGTRTSYGAGFGSVAAVGYTSGDSAHWCTSTTNANFTLTLPSDYAGEPVCIGLVGASGTSGGIVTWSGTAGVTGTTSVSDIMPTAAATHAPVTKRITNLTSSNAGQTIIGTVNTLDSGGAVMLDCWWLEAKSPPPVVVCNIAKLTASGYTGNYAGWSGTESSRDSDVDAWNADLRTLVAEFDSMVQIADLDAAIGKDATSLYTDGLHPNEQGAARIVDAIRDAVKRVTPTSTSVTFNMNTSAPRAGSPLRPHVNGLWYTMDHANAEVSTGLTITAGDMWAIPIWVTQGREFWNRLAVRTAVTGTSGTTSIRWGLYDDVGWSGYPCELVNEATAAGALAISTAANTIVMSPTSGTGSITWVLDPGLYWLCVKFTVIRTGQTMTRLQGTNNVMTPLTSGADVNTSVANMPNGYKLTGQGTTALASTFPTGATATAGAPYVAVQAFIQPTN